MANPANMRRPLIKIRMAGAVVIVFLLMAVLRSFASQETDEATMTDGYWTLPLAPQGEAPIHWNPIERSLDPRSCAECHSDKHREWRSSLHAKAFSPGLVGQLLGYDSRQTGNCMQCHAPLAEQRQAFEAARARNEADRVDSQGLAAAGNSCAGCHLRGHRHYGPPQRETEKTGPSDPTNPHGGVYRTAFFEESEYCSACHQFPQAYAVNGKPLQNTYVEWQASSYAARGVTCQVCHMPERKHLWRGIHDPEMTASGLTADTAATAAGAHLTITNTGVGHAFPTYITPLVELRGVRLDAGGRDIPGSEVRQAIQRVVEWTGGVWVERSDTRLLPGQSASLLVPWGEAASVRLWLEVTPDHFYDHEVYDDLLERLDAGSPAARLIAEADRRAAASRYRLFGTVVVRP